MTDIYEQLKQVGSTINHCGDYGKLMYHPEGYVWWIGADSDGEGTTLPPEIKKRFLAVSGIKAVFAEAETGPDEDDDWSEKGGTTFSHTDYDYSSHPFQKTEYMLPGSGWQQIEYPKHPAGSIWQQITEVCMEPSIPHDVRKSMNHAYIYATESGEIIFGPPYEEIPKEHIALIKQVFESLPGAKNVTGHVLWNSSYEDCDENPAYRMV